MFNRKDLLGLRDLSKEEILSILKRADALKPRVRRHEARGHELAGRAVATLFYEDSARSKMSFLAAAGYLGASAHDVGVGAGGLSSVENLIETGKNLDAMGFDAFVIRHQAAGAARLLAEHVRARVVNGGDGTNEHPSQALYDLYTIRHRKGGFEGLKVAIVGDIRSSRVARSNLYGLTKLGAKVTLCAPTTLADANLAAHGAVLTHDVRDAVTGADVVMGLRVQAGQSAFPSLGEYAELFGITPAVMALAKPDALLMHPGPVNRGIELSAEVIDSDQSVIYEQVENGVAVRMAILAIIMGV